MDITGTIHAIMDEAQVTASLRKREFVVRYDENPMYPQYISFELIQDKCSIIDGYNVGDPIKVEFKLKGREWVDPNGVKKYFNTLQAWRVGRPSAQPAEQQSSGGGGYAPAPAAAPMPPAPNFDDDGGDLPF